MSDHEWCRDVPRDEAVRAAEDAAAVPAIMHRDLPEIVADLRERVAELERDRRPATWQEEEAAVEGAWLLCGLEPDWPNDEPGTIVRHAESMRHEIGRLRARVAELEAAPPPRGWLTEEERACLDEAVRTLYKGFSGTAHVLRVLHTRSAPSKVERPPLLAVEDLHSRDERWIAAIRAAGGEVE